MHDFLANQPPWYVIGPLLGLTVVLVLWTVNERLGVVGGYSSVLERLGGRTRGLSWKVWFLAGVVAGGLVFSLLAGSWHPGSGYGWLSRSFGDAGVAIGLLGGGVLIGYGAKTAGGCTSGNGLSGSSLGSPASLVATMTFMATAIGTAFVTRWLF